MSLVTAEVVVANVSEADYSRHSRSEMRLRLEAIIAAYDEAGTLGPETPDGLTNRPDVLTVGSAPAADEHCNP